MRVNPKFPLSSQFPGSTEYRAPIGHHIHLTTRPPLFRITVKFDLQTRVSRTISCPFPRVPRAPSPPDPVFSIACTPVLHCLCRYTRKLAGVSVCTNGSIRINWVTVRGFAAGQRPHGYIRGFRRVCSSGDVTLVSTTTTLTSPSSGEARRSRGFFDWGGKMGRKGRRGDRVVWRWGRFWLFRGYSWRILCWNIFFRDRVDCEWGVVDGARGSNKWDFLIMEGEGCLVEILDFVKNSIFLDFIVRNIRDISLKRFPINVSQPWNSLIQSVPKISLLLCLITFICDITKYKSVLFQINSSRIKLLE